MTGPRTCTTPAAAAPFNNHLMDPLSATHLRQRAGLHTNPRQHPSNGVQQAQPARSRSIFTPTVQQQQQLQLQRFNLLKQKMRQRRDDIELPANAASKLGPEAEKAFPSHSSKASNQSTSLSLMRGMQRAMKSGEYSDLTILCENKKFFGHKVVVCSQSKVLAAAMKKGFKESELNLIDLSGDGTLLVNHLITFLYTGNYAGEDDSAISDLTPVTPSADLCGDDPENSKGHHSHAMPEVADGKSASLEQSPDYSLDVKMYALSDQYDIPALGMLAKAKLDKAFTYHWNSKSFIETVPHVYESTLESNLGLRTVVLTHARKHAGEFMQADPLKSSFYSLLATTPDFCTALLSLYMSQPLPFPGTAGGFADFATWNGYNACGPWSGRGRGLVNAADDSGHPWPGMWPGMPYAGPFNQF